MRFQREKPAFSDSCRRRLLAVMVYALMGCCGTARAGNGDAVSASELKKLSLEDLSNITVTSVSMRPQKLLEAPSAIQVITRDDIHRAGATSLPQALRLATNLQVAQVSASSWAISARGFNNTTSNKLLVLVDGRIVYTPLYAGVFWDVQDVVLEDVERIEVISGPGTTLWGSNAVNGVINIITRNAADTQGTLLAGSDGNTQGDVTARWGGHLDKDTTFRVYGRTLDQDALDTTGGASANNQWHLSHGGFRADWNGHAADRVTLQGDTYAGMEAQAGNADTDVSGGNLTGHWQHRHSDTMTTSVQAYFDHTYRDIPGEFTESLDTSAMDLQQNLEISDTQQLVWGGGYRRVTDNVQNSALLAFNPADVTQDWYNAFAQDEIGWYENRLQLTLGSKAEHNPYSGFDIEPSARLAWQASPHQMLWSAVSRADRTPSRIDRDFYVPGNAPFELAGGPDFVSEQLRSWELGYRGQPHRAIDLTASTYYNDYGKLRSITELNPPAPFPLILTNGQRATSYGVELTADYRVARQWRLRAGYDNMVLKFRDIPGSGVNLDAGEANDPHQQFFLRSSLDISPRWQLDNSLRAISAIHTMGVPGYTEMDMRLGWVPAAAPKLEFSLIGQNLLHRMHAEFGLLPAREEIPRSLLLRVVWRP